MRFREYSEIRTDVETSAGEAQVNRVVRRLFYEVNRRLKDVR